MLTKGFKNEEQKKLDQILHAGLQLAFVPETWHLEAKRKLDELLQNAAHITLVTLIRFPANQLITHVKSLNFSLSNLEHLADLLVKVSAVEPEHQSNLTHKALAIYKYAQEENKTFSWGIAQKIRALENKHSAS